MVTINACPICGDGAKKEILTDKGKGFTEEKVLFCTNCGLAFLSPRMDDDELKEYYSSNLFRDDFRREFNADTGNRQILYDDAIRRWGVVEPFMFGGTLLDIGCSSGEFMAAASGRFDVYGIDSTPKDIDAVDVGTAYVGTFPEYDFPDVGEFDVISTFHTLEHVSNPQEFLDGVYSRLDDEGLFILEYPDLKLAAISRRALHNEYFQKSHLHDFSTINLLMILVRSGFRINFAFVPQREYPRDKNALLLCAKSKFGPGEIEANRGYAADLLQVLREKVQ